MKTKFLFMIYIRAYCIRESARWSEKIKRAIEFIKLYRKWCKTFDKSFNENCQPIDEYIKESK